MCCHEVRLLILCFIFASLPACQSGHATDSDLPFEVEFAVDTSPASPVDEPQHDSQSTPPDFMSDDTDTASPSPAMHDGNTSHTTPTDAEAGGTITATRFSANAVHWRVPESGHNDGFFSPTWAHSTRWFTTRDLNGDGHVDLIQTGDSQRENGFVWRDEVGPYWKVWFGGTDGFATQSIRWTVPESGQSDGFFFTSWNDGSRWFSVRDLDGDSFPDLIQTADPSREGGFVWRDEVGPYWKVWRGEMNGFSQVPIVWRVPDSGLDDGFFALQWSNATRWFATIDVNGDALPDLIQTANPAREGGHVFSDARGSFWKVWANNGDGFSTVHIRWSVPDSGLSDGFFFPYWTMGERVFSTTDLNGDGLVDLIQSADSERPGGYVWEDNSGPFWRVWLGTGEGFETTWSRWSVPNSGLGDGFFALWYLNGERSFGTIDMTGDGIPDLVQTADSDRAGGFVWRDHSGPYWKVWKGTGNGFAPTSARWAVPSNSTDDGFYTTHSSAGSQWFSTMDLNGDARPDLVQSGDSERDGGFVWMDENGPHWRVWFAQ
jgi:hypothetical protein